jgi:Roadblock/LC7 domain
VTKWVANVHRSQPGSGLVYGVTLALSEDIPDGSAEYLAAITSGLVSLMQGAARIFDAGQPARALVEMQGGLMLIKAISDGSSLAVPPARTDGEMAEAGRTAAGGADRRDEDVGGARRCRFRYRQWSAPILLLTRVDSKLATISLVHFGAIGCIQDKAYYVISGRSDWHVIGSHAFILTCLGLI